MRYSLQFLFALVTAACIFFGSTRFKTYDTVAYGRYYTVDVYWPWRCWADIIDGEVSVGIWLPWDDRDSYGYNRYWRRYDILDFKSHHKVGIDWVKR